MFHTQDPQILGAAITTAAWCLGFMYPSHMFI